jgi:CheY-like chemotaxis protein
MKKETRETILVIEDDVDVLSMIIKHLEYLGYRVISARDGMEGLKMVEAGGYDLVITDIVMPYVSGVGVVTALKTNHPSIPVIAITGYGKEPEDAALERRADVVLSKPVRMAVLKEHMAGLLARTP